MMDKGSPSVEVEERYLAAFKMWRAKLEEDKLQYCDKRFHILADKLVEDSAKFTKVLEEMGYLANTSVELLIGEQLEGKGLAASPTKRQWFRKDDVADGILIFVCSSPDNAEAAVGDLMQRFSQVAARHSGAISSLYFCWELSLLIVSKGRKRLVASTVGPLLNKWFKGTTT